MAKQITEKQPGFIVLNNILVECIFWKESRYHRTAPNDDDWCEYDVYSLNNPPKNLADIREGFAYKTKEEAIKAHNDYINMLIDQYKKKLL